MMVDGCRVATELAAAVGSVLFQASPALLGLHLPLVEVWAGLCNLGGVWHVDCDW